MNTLINTLVATLIVGTTAAPVSAQPAQSPSTQNNLIVFEQTEDEKRLEEKKIEDEKAAELKRLEEEAAAELKKLEEEESAKISSSFTYEISSYSTSYSTSKSNANRNYNMELSSKAIDGTILYPGDTFSYNNVILSNRTPENDYLSAPIITNGTLSNAIGGGICQVSSTLYNSALYSGMTITTRKNHSLMVGYVPAGRDATVSWGTIDFCFRNDLNIPVMIESKTENGIVKIRFLSSVNPNLPEIKLSTHYSNGYYYLDRYVDGKIDYSTKSAYKG